MSRFPTWRSITPEERNDEWMYMTREEFVDGVESGCFTQYDGFGYLATDKAVCENTDCFSVCWGADEMYTHVLWFNK